jgi:hypothetical protein
LRKPILFQEARFLNFVPAPLRIPSDTNSAIHSHCTARSSGIHLLQENKVRIKGEVREMRTSQRLGSDNRCHVQHYHLSRWTVAGMQRKSPRMSSRTGHSHANCAVLELWRPAQCNMHDVCTSQQSHFHHTQLQLQNNLRKRQSIYPWKSA